MSAIIDIILTFGLRGFVTCLWIAVGWLLYDLFIAIRAEVEQRNAERKWKDENLND